MAARISVVGERTLTSSSRASDSSEPYVDFYGSFTLSESERDKISVKLGQV